MSLTDSNPSSSGRTAAPTDLDVERFVATVAHDLEASLLVLTKNLELLRAESATLSVGQEDLLERIGHTTRRMKRLLSGVQKLTQASSEPGFTSVSIDAVVKDSLETLAPIIDERDAHVVIGGTLPAVFGDHDQLVQLFQNLLSNAIKFGPDGGRVTVGAAREPDAWRIAVSDQGPGIATENRDRVFEPFRRLRETGHVEGTGLGLTICRRVALNHGGRLTIEQSKPHGARLVFTLPDQRPAPAL